MSAIVCATAYDSLFHLTLYVFLSVAGEPVVDTTVDLLLTSADDFAAFDDRQNAHANLPLVKNNCAGNNMTMTLSYPRSVIVRAHSLVRYPNPFFLALSISNAFSASFFICSRFSRPFFALRAMTRYRFTGDLSCSLTYRSKLFALSTMSKSLGSDSKS